MEEFNGSDSFRFVVFGCSILGVFNSYFFDRILVIWLEEKFFLVIKKRSFRISLDFFFNGVLLNRLVWGMVIVIVGI